jgi:hypothetical protein
MHDRTILVIHWMRNGWRTSINHHSCMPIENIINQCQVDAKVDMVGLVKDVLPLLTKLLTKPITHAWMNQGCLARANGTIWS